jgi:lactoylglutathione lyase
MTTFREAFPILYVADVPRAIAFYEQVFGFEPTFRWEDEDSGQTTFAFLRLPPLGIGIAKRRAEAVGDFELCIYADDADTAADALRGAGATEVRPPQDEPWGERRAVYRDLDGHTLHVAQKL